MEYLPNKLTPFNSKIYYKEENYLKVKTAVFKYITPPIVKFGTSVRCTTGYIAFLYFKCPVHFKFYYIT